MMNAVDSFKPSLAALCLASILGLTACSPSYVVLLADEDGSLGEVVVTTPQGATVLKNERDAIKMSDKPNQKFTVSEEQIQKDFGQALAVSPQKPVSYYLYFQGGSAALTADSVADIPNIIAEIKSRPAADISVIGHTDTVGDDADNARLSLQRAKSVASLFTEALPDANKITIDSHGEKNLLIPTPDNTPEPKNRRVEVTVR